MSKKQPNKEEIISKLVENRDKGISDKETFEYFRKDYFEDSVANIILFSPKEENIIKARLYINMVLIIIGLIIILKIIFGISSLTQGDYADSIISFIHIMIFGFLIYYINSSRDIVQTLQIILGLSILSLSSSAYADIEGINILGLLPNIFLFVISFISLRKLLPHLSGLNRPKKDELGNYIFAQ